ncbi:MAG TPA: hypothetical protein VFA75_07160 [Nevskia sp.]|nr:hypothetical protein [Nevskia sp.]
MEHQAATSAARRFPGHTLAERASSLTAERRAVRKLDILSNSDLLLEAVVEFGDVEAFEALAVAAYVRRDLSLLDDVLDRAAEGMAQGQVRELSVADVLAEDDDEAAERRRDEREGR